MTNGEKIKELYPRTPTGVRLDVDGSNGTMTFITDKDWWNAEYKEPIKALEQESSRDMEEIKEVINCDADAETKCKMISNILTAKSHYFEEP